MFYFYICSFSFLNSPAKYTYSRSENKTLFMLFIYYVYLCFHYFITKPQPYHPAAQDRLPTEAKQGWAGQYLDRRPPEKTRLLLEEVLVRPAGGAHPFICVGPNAPG